MSTSAKPLFAVCLLAVFVAYLILRGLGAMTTAQASGMARYVTTSGTDSNNDCTSMGSPCASLQNAIDRAAPGDEIRVASGVYTGVQVRPRIDVTTTGVVTQMVYVSKTITVQGGYTTTDSFATANPTVNPTILDAQGQGRVIYVTGDISVTVAGLRLTRGDASNQGGAFSTSPDSTSAGGAFYAITATVTLSNNAIVSNSASFGGGSYLRDGAQAVSGNRIESNTATTRRGGGVYLAFSNARLSNNTIVSNTANDGGGVGLSQSTAILRSNTILSNTARGSGGGVLLLSRDVVTLTQNTIGNNSASSGGGLYGAVSTMTLTSNQIVSNSSNSYGTGGGALYYFGGVATLRGNVIMRNSTVGIDPATIYLEDSPSMITANTIAGNLGAGLIIHYDVGTQVISNTIVNNTSSGVSLYSSAATISGNTISGNQGGIGVDSGTVTVTLNSISENGIGLSLYQGGATISDNSIVGNTALICCGGGGVRASSAVVTLTHNLIYHNATSSSGGGLTLADGSASLQGNRIISNSAQVEGGGLSLDSSNATFENDVIADNVVGSGIGSGSGLLAVGGRTSFVHTTIARNTGGDGSGVSNHSSVAFRGPATFMLTNTILVSQAVGISVTAGSTATLNGVLWFNNGINSGGPGLITANNEHTGDPAFAADGYHLTARSAAIDQGIAAGVTTDIDGQPRPDGDAPDLGADEYYLLDRSVYLPMVTR